MNKADFVAVVADKHPELTKTAVEGLVEDVFTTLVEAVKQEDGFSLRGFGTFRPAIRKARTGRNPRTGEAVHIPAKITVSFKPAAALVQDVK